MGNGTKSNIDCYAVRHLAKQRAQLTPQHGPRLIVKGRAKTTVAAQRRELSSTPRNL